MPDDTTNAPSLTAAPTPSAPQLFPRPRPTGVGEPSRGAAARRLPVRRVSSDSVVIYTSEPEVTLPEPVRIDRNEMISAWWLPVVQYIAPVVIPIAVEWLTKKDDKTPTAPPVQQGCPCNVNVIVNTGHVNVNNTNTNTNTNTATGGTGGTATAAGGTGGGGTATAGGATAQPPSSGTPAPQPADRPVTPPAGGGTTNPPAGGGGSASGGDAQGGSAASGSGGSATGGSATGGDATSAGGSATGGDATGGDAKSGALVIAPPDPSQWQGDEDALAKYQVIMDEFLTTTFSDGAAAAGYLQERVDEAGLTVTVSGNGFEVRDRVPDPAGVADQLRSQGIRDQQVINAAVAQTNAALQTIEQFVQAAQASLRSHAAADATTEPDGATGATAAHPDAAADDAPVLGAVFLDMAPQWAGLVPGGFTTSGVTSQPAAEMTPQTLLAFTHTTQLGIEVTAAVDTSVSIVAGGSAPDGLHVAPFVSMFDREEAWTLRA